MTQADQLMSTVGTPAADSAGDPVGPVVQVYLDDTTGEPRWVTVGQPDGVIRFAPVYGSRIDRGTLQLAVTAELVGRAPAVSADGHISAEQSQALFRHYDGHLGAPASGHTGPQPTDPSAEDTSMTRSEEQLHVGTEQVASGTARIRKTIVTEQVHQTVPVTHEEISMQRDPITGGDGGPAAAGGQIAEQDYEIILHAERLIVTKEVVPVERIRIAKTVVTEQQDIDETLRKEQIDDVTVDPAAPQG